MIVTERLTRTFRKRGKGTVTAVRDLDLCCDDGEIYALLGPNGAGKTTTLRILSTLIDPTSGDARIGPYSVLRNKREIRQLIGVVSYETGVYERMTPREIARYFGRLNDLDAATVDRRLEEIAVLLRMTDFVDERTDGFSTGMKQKTVIMRALITRPRVLIFDEPTAGLDVLTAKSVMDHIRDLRARGHTILFSTHVLWEAEKLADRIGIIHEGGLVAEGTLDELRSKSGHADLEDVFFSLVET